MDQSAAPMSPALRVLADAGIKLHAWQERIVAPGLPEGTPLGFAAERDNRATGQRRRRLSNKNEKCPSTGATE